MEKINKPQCFFPDSTYTEEFCEKSKKTGFVDACAEDEALSDGYCKEFAATTEGQVYDPSPGNIYLKCNHHDLFMREWCDKKSNDTVFVAVCATDASLGPTYCLAFVEEDAVRSECWDHQDYAAEYCNKKALDSTEDTSCATNERTKATYCDTLATKKEQCADCWKVDTFAPAYCREVDYEDTKCSEVRGAQADGPAGGPAGSLADSLEVAGQASAPAAADGGSLTDMEKPDGEVIEALAEKEEAMQEAKKEAVQHAYKVAAEARQAAQEADAKANAALEAAEAKAVEAARHSKVSERPAHSSKRQKQKLNPWKFADTLKESQKPFDTLKQSRKPFGIRAGAKLWKQKKSEKKRIHPFKPRGRPAALWAAVEEGAQSGLRPPVMTRQGDGKLVFQGIEASP